MKFRKKPVVIEAVQFLGPTNLQAMKEAWGQPFEDVLTFHDNKVVGEQFLEIRTLEGVFRAQYGDWILKGVKGEFYPCKPDIFDATYEVVE